MTDVPRTRTATLFNWFKSVIAQTSFFLLWVGMSYATFAKIIEFFPNGGHTPIPTFLFGMTVVVLCGLPKVLMFCVAMFVRRNPNRRTRVRIIVARPLLPDATAAAARAPDPRPSSPQASTSIAVETAEALWQYEASQADKSRENFLIYAGAYGFLASMSLLLCASMALKYVVNDELPVAPWRVYEAIAVGTAVAVAFGKDFGRMLVRASTRDSSTQMLAWSSKRLLIIIVATVVFMTLALAGEMYAIDMVKRGFASVSLGAAVAILGERLAGAMSERAAKVLGVSVTKRTMDTLQFVEGLEDEDVLRLAEEGVDSAHALAFAATPRLFFGTPYPLQRICDWQNQALLQVKVGASRAQLFRERLMLAGAIETRRFALALYEGADDEQKKQVANLLGFGTSEMAKVALDFIVADEDIARLAVYRGACPCEDPAREDLKPREPMEEP